VRRRGDAAARCACGVPLVAVLMAEVVAHYHPKLVEMHNYSAAHSIRQKMYNWQTLNRAFRGRVQLQRPWWCFTAVLCCAVLCCAVLCCAVLCCAVLCCAVLCCAVLCCSVLLCAVFSALCCFALQKRY
jgi:hypothetical protein